MIFDITAVADIKWNDGAFKSLVLPSNHKDLILALTESQVAGKDSFDDVIQGKGMSNQSCSPFPILAESNVQRRQRHDYAAQRPTRSWENIDR